MATTAERAPTIYHHPRAEGGLSSWLTTVDHKRIGVMYGYTAFTFFLIGGLEALLLRIHLAQANSEFLTAGAYNALFTMHGTTMIFLVVMPLASAFMNYLLPLQLGARDVAFPRLNALSFWIFLFGGIFLYSTFLFGSALPPSYPGGAAVGNMPINGGPGGFDFLASAPNGGWFGYQPHAGPDFSQGTVLDYWAFGLQILGLASLISAVNFIVTVFNMRAKGMRLLRMPVFCWTTLVTAFLLLFSLPIIAVALFMVTFDRQFGAVFFDPAVGGDPILWQHLFWLFGHPEVYILIIPAFGIVSEVVPVFSRKPLFGYAAMVFSTIAIAFLGFGVWAHHMFASGIPPVAQAAFGLGTMTIAIPTGIKIFNWLGTIWLGRLRLKTPMLFCLGMIAMFVIGGLSGVTHAVVPSDWQQTDTYYIVAHFHYVIFGGSLFAFFGGFYYWYPKLRGRLMSEKLGKLHFWLTFIGFNLTFAPMHWLGLQGMVRRTWKYGAEFGLERWNVVSTIGSFIIALSVLVFIFNWWRSKTKGDVAGLDPWDARTLEWTIPNPTPEYNYAVVPVVSELDDFWHRKYTEDPEGRPVRRPDADQLITRLEFEGLNPPEPIPLPRPSYFPIVLAAGIPLISWGLVYHLTAWGKALVAIGVILVLGGATGWGIEPLFDEALTEVEDSPEAVPTR
ncbi:MAG: cytochrome c oxidase subunit I [Actinomycetes bacterium]